MESDTKCKLGNNGITVGITWRWKKKIEMIVEKIRPKTQFSVFGKVFYLNITWWKMSGSLQVVLS